MAVTLIILILGDSQYVGRNAMTPPPPLHGYGFATTGQEFLESASSNIANATSAREQPQMPPQGGGFATTGQEYFRNQTPPPGLKTTLPTAGGQVSPGQTVLPPRFGDTAPMPGGPSMPKAGGMTEDERRRVESSQQFGYGAGSPSTVPPLKCYDDASLR